MIRFCLCLVLPAALALPVIAVDSPPPRRVPYFSSREAPEILVYKLFFREFVALQRAADEASRTAQAYGVSDYVTPRYVYQNCGRY